MTDREMLLMAYGAIKALSTGGGQLALIVELLEDHLYPTPMLNQEAESVEPNEFEV